MSDDIQRLTFEQREGLAPMPQQLQLGELPKSVRAPLWGLIYDEMRNTHGNLDESWGRVLRSYWINRFHLDADLFRHSLSHCTDWVKPIILSRGYAEALGFIEHSMRALSSQSSGRFVSSVDRCLERGGVAYRVLGRTSIMPISGPEEAQGVLTAFEELRGYAGARSHLKRAAELLTAGSYADAVRESIHAVESVARLLEVDSRTLEPALAALERRGHLHQALKKGFSSIYGYTNDENGVRHALLDSGDSNVNEADALYMFTACAAFAANLHRKSTGS